MAISATTVADSNFQKSSEHCYLQKILSQIPSPSKTFSNFQRLPCHHRLCKRYLCQQLPATSSPTLSPPTPSLSNFSVNASPQTLSLSSLTSYSHLQSFPLQWSLIHLFLLHRIPTQHTFPTPNNFPSNYFPSNDFTSSEVLTNNVSSNNFHYFNFTSNNFHQLTLVNLSMWYYRWISMGFIFFVHSSSDKKIYISVVPRTLLPINLLHPTTYPLVHFNFTD